MIDIHTHILPNTDDGASSPTESLEMLERMERDGITHVVATPHCTQNAPLFREQILERVADLNALLVALKSKVTVFPGSEISFFDGEDFRANYQNRSFCSLNDHLDYALIEFPWRSEQVPPDALETLQWLREQGTTPIIAHPERTPFLRENPRFIEQLVEGGAILQVTVDSICGAMSSQAKTTADMILRAFEPVVLASDSHNLARCSGLSVGYERVEIAHGKARADSLRANCDAILQKMTSK